jgi:hypothetical protein
VSKKGNSSHINWSVLGFLVPQVYQKVFAEWGKVPKVLSYINNHAIYNSIYELIHNFFKFHLKLIHELRGFAPIGIMEQWDNGMMGLKEFLTI